MRERKFNPALVLSLLSVIAFVSACTTNPKSEQGSVASSSSTNKKVSATSNSSTNSSSTKDKNKKVNKSQSHIHPANPCRTALEHSHKDDKEGHEHDFDCIIQSTVTGNGHFHPSTDKNKRFRHVHPNGDKAHSHH